MPRRDSLELDDRTFRLFRDMYAEMVGFHVPDARAHVMANRLRPLAEAAACDSFSDYYHLVRYGANGEYERALEAVLNNETYFFRESAQLEAAAELVRDNNSGRPFRILSAGCSSGEEPYSLAMLLVGTSRDARPLAHIVGADVSRRVLDKAQSGRYGPGSFRSTEGHYLDWHFKTVEGELELDERLRDMVRFERVNLIDGSQVGQLGTFDAVFCRNVLIYFEPDGRRRVVSSLADVLRPGGHLFLGHSESLYRMSNEFEMVQFGRAIAYRKPRPTTPSERERS